MCGEDISDSKYKIISPDRTTIFGDTLLTLSSSEHFVIRATSGDSELLNSHLGDGMPLSQQVLFPDWRIFGLNSSMR